MTKARVQVELSAWKSGACGQTPRVLRADSTQSSPATVAHRKGVKTSHWPIGRKQGECDANSCSQEVSGGRGLHAHESRFLTILYEEAFSRGCTDRQTLSKDSPQATNH